MLIKILASSINGFRGVYSGIKIITAFYIGAGFGNIIHFAGRYHGFEIVHFF